MTPELVIRPAGRDDLPLIVAIERASFVQPWSADSLREALAQALANERTVVLVAGWNGAVCGYAIAWTVGDEGEIADLAVAPAQRGSGIGTRLVDAIIEECTRRGAARVFLEVRAGNDGARRLYERCGFVPVGLRRRYYQDDEDALIMAKSLA